MKSQKPQVIRTLSAGVFIAISRPRVWLPLLALSLLFGLAIAAPVHQSGLEAIAPTSGFAQDAANLGVLTTPRWIHEDWSRLQNAPFASASTTLAPLLLLSSLLGVLVTAGWMQTALHGRCAHGLKQFLSGAGQHFFPMLRLWMFGLCCYFGVTWVIWDMPGEWVMAQLFPEGDTGRASSERIALWAENARVLIYAFGLLKVEILLDLSRAAIISRQGRSAFLGLFWGLSFWIKRWPSTLLLIVFGLALEAGWIALVLKITREFGIPLWSLAVSVPIGRICMRGARASSLALLYHASVPPANKPDIHHVEQTLKA